MSLDWFSYFTEKESEVAQLCPTLCDPMDCSPTRFLHPWDFPGKSTGVGCHFLLQEIVLIQGLHPGLLHCRQTLYRLGHREVILLKGYHNGYSTESLFCVCSPYKWKYPMQGCMKFQRPPSMCQTADTSNPLQNGPWDIAVEPQSLKPN